jgi:spore germination cell wall hydrolase CwlJ-like protein
MNKFIFNPKVIIALLFSIVLIIILNKQYAEKGFIKNKDYVRAVIAKVINKECGYCPVTDKVLIASSILNRMDDCRFESEVDDIVKGQYCISDTFDIESYQITKLVMEGLIRDYDVLYFFNPKTATDKKFTNWLKNNHNLVVKTNYHEYYN